MKGKYFDEEKVFRFVWEHADDGMWTGDAGSVAEEFKVSEDEAYDILSELTDRNRLQRVGSETYIITRWRERDESADDLPT